MSLTLSEVKLENAGKRAFFATADEELLEFKIGNNEVLVGLEKAVIGMQVGQKNLLQYLLKMVLANAEWILLKKPIRTGSRSKFIGSRKKASINA